MRSVIYRLVAIGLLTGLLQGCSSGPSTQPDAPQGTSTPDKKLNPESTTYSPPPINPK
jgi:hypothetical protein